VGSQPELGARRRQQQTQHRATHAGADCQLNETVCSVQYSCRKKLDANGRVEVHASSGEGSEAEPKEGARSGRR
jgi:hypothetical protein